jgi:hypothetical protein
VPESAREVSAPADNMAERVGFEPTVPLPVRLISNQVRSTKLRHLSAAVQPSIYALAGSCEAEVGTGSQNGFDPLGSSPNPMSTRERATWRETTSFRLPAVSTRFWAVVAIRSLLSPDKK